MCQHPIKPESPAVDPVVKRQTFDIGQKRVGEIIANPKLLIIVKIPRLLYVFSGFRQNDHFSHALCRARRF